VGFRDHIQWCRLVIRLLVPHPHQCK
jgi:hypothetical protein